MGHDSVRDTCRPEPCVTITISWNSCVCASRGRCGRQRTTENGRPLEKSEYLKRSSLPCQMGSSASAGVGPASGSWRFGLVRRTAAEVTDDAAERAPEARTTKLALARSERGERMRIG